MQPIALSHRYSPRISNREPHLTRKVRETLNKEPGLSVKELAERLKTNRQFIAGFLAAFEERDEINSRMVGPARICFKSNVNKTGRSEVT